MRPDAPNLDDTLRLIDAANRQDPNLRDGRPLAEQQGILASGWLRHLCADPTPELQLSVRAHHLRRWELQRSEYPAGRDGYLRWRRHNKAHQAEALATIMNTCGWAPASIERARTLLSRTKLRRDPATQALEDAACLVFLETQFEAMALRTDNDHLVSIVTKTLKKMSPNAITLAGSVGLNPTATAVLADAAAALDRQEPCQ